MFHPLILKASLVQFDNDPEIGRNKQEIGLSTWTLDIWNLGGRLCNSSLAMGVLPQYETWFKKM